MAGLRFGIVLSFLTVLLTDVSPANADSKSGWPQWRGPMRTGEDPTAKWPESLAGESLQPLWRIELGPSYSGPIVSEDRVFTTETADEKEEVVRALDRKTGAELWSVRWPGALSVPFFAKANGSWIRSTPAYDGECLYVAGICDVLVCLDAATGSERWRVDFVARHGTPLPTFGYVSSPLIDGEDLYVQAGGAVCKLDKRTGREIWRSMDDGGGMMGSAFSSPVIAELAGTRQLIVQTRTTLAGVELSGGTVLWSKEVPAFRGMNILTPTVVGDGIFTSAYGGRSFFFDLVKEGSQFQIKERWSNKVQGYMSSPVVLDGRIYMHLRNQRCACLDVASGKEDWISREHFGKYWSLCTQGNRILALDETGMLYLIEASPEKLKIVDSRKVSDQLTWAHLAVVDNQVFVRELNGLAAYRWQD